jgi:hypothetical protein
MARRWCGVLLVLICAACTRSNRPIELKPAFSDDTVVGELRPSWSVTSDERGNGNGLERRVAVRVDAVNQLSDKLYVRLTKLRLIGPSGPIRIDDASVACALASGETPSCCKAAYTGRRHRSSARPAGRPVHVRSASAGVPSIASSFDAAAVRQRRDRCGDRNLAAAPACAAAK